MKKSTWKNKIILMLIAFFTLMNVNIKYVQATDDFMAGADKFLQAKENLAENSVSSQAEIDPASIKNISNMVYSNSWNCHSSYYRCSIRNTIYARKC